MRIALLISLFIIGTASCTKNPRYEKSHSFRNEVWSYSDTAKFKVKVLDTTTKYDIFLTLRRNINYPYSNIWVNMGTLIPDSTHRKYSDLELTLEEKNGRPTGNRVGNNIEHVILIKKGVKMQIGVYSFWVNQKMREEKLHGILNVGVRVQKQTQ